MKRRNVPPRIVIPAYKHRSLTIAVSDNAPVVETHPTTTMAPPEIKKLAMIGCGAMGGGMALLFAENGCHVLLKDPSNQAMDKVIKQAKEDGVGEMMSKYQDYESLCKSLDSPRVFVWSLPHGSVGDSVLDGLMPYLEKDDIIIDAANEHWENSERRIGKCVTKGIRYVAMGVSGGYQAAYVLPAIFHLPTSLTKTATAAADLPCVRAATPRRSISSCHS
jgi:6-phosphogluconate dehydrogenase